MNLKIRTNTINSTVKYALLALLPILSIYSFMPLISVGYFLLLLYIFIDFIVFKNTIEFNYKIFIIMFLLSILNIISGLINSDILDFSSSVNNTAGMIVFSIILGFYANPKYLDKDKFYNACEIIAIIATIFLFYQYFSYYILDEIQLGFIPFLDLKNKDYLYNISISYGRPNSFFYEPAHYAIYLLPVFAIAMLKKRFLISIILFVGLILSTSTTGIIISLFIIIQIIFNNKNTKKIQVFFVALIFLLILIFIIPDNLLKDFLFEKLSRESILGSYRIFKPLEYLSYLDTSGWIFGVGLNQISTYLQYEVYDVVSNFANVYIFSLLSFGVIGSAIWIGYLLSLHKRILSDYKVIFYVTLLICFTDQLLFNHNLLYLLIFVYAFSSISEKGKIA